VSKGRQLPGDIEIHPLTPDRWPDLESLFGPNGAVAGCWCMWFRQTAAEFDARHGEQNRESLKAIVDAGQVPGLMAYVAGKPVGWCAVAPRSDFGRIERSRILNAPGNESAWAVVCFYIERHHRKLGVGSALLRAAVAHALSQGARGVEGYPVDPLEGRVSSGSAFTGLAAMFHEAGFQEVARHSTARPIMRFRA
jgi:GNAT superfamily N-acetyltransferase